MNILSRRIPRLHVLVVGDVMLDHYLWGDATRISPEAPVPVVDISRDSWTAGGAANVALNLAALGARCTLAGRIGDDDAGQRLSTLLAKRGVRLIPTPGRGPTIVKTRVLVQHQQLCRLDRESAPDDYAVSADQAEVLLGRTVRSCDAVIFSDYAKGVIGEAMVGRLAALARKAKTFTALDPKPKRPLRFQGLDLITPNKREALQLAGLESSASTPFPAEEVCTRLHERHGTGRLVVTLGEDGMLLSEKGRLLGTLPTAAREVYDVSGAGDTALAGLVLGCVGGVSLREAAEFANAAAGVVVGKLGTATATFGEVRDFLANLARRPNRKARVQTVR